MLFKIRDHWLQILAILALAGALLPFPFLYYQGMNWIVVIAALMTAYRAHQKNTQWILWLFVAIAILFNPVAPFFLRQDIWRMADIVVALLFLASFFII